MSIVGLGWGRATRPMTGPELVTGDGGVPVTVNALAADEEGEPLPPIGAEEAEDVSSPGALFNPVITARVVLMQNVVPAIATAGAYLTFRFVPVFGF
jgi:PiT family inorganic phosphate transporter